jgi:DNA polymerase IV (DinB-like DNA polymerase)
MPISQAYRLCPNGIYLRPNFPLYERASTRIMGIIRKYAEKFEQVSIDEAYLGISGTASSYEGVQMIARSLKEDIFKRESLTCSIGVGPTKIIAKVASDFEKPNGLTIVEPHEVETFLFPLPVRKIPGVGGRTEAILSKIGVRTIGQLTSKSLEELHTRLGKHGLWIWRAAKGLDDSEIIESWESKSISAERTFEKDVQDQKIIEEKLRSLAQEIFERITSEGYLFRTVGLKIRFEDFTTYTRAKSLRGHQGSKELIIRVANLLMREFQNEERKVRLLGLKVAGLQRTRGIQRNILQYA